ncbi:MAG TPA: FtsH protease activity modulator HflK [Steroidobacteraceae bacterium]|nr:FtsH protease activity modulator HflK [Steroidobacteraceae bacterium]
MAWNEPGGGKNPWDRRPNQGSNLDDLVRNWQRKLSALFGGRRGGGSTGGGTGGGAPGWGPLAAVVVIILIAVSTFYQVDASEAAVIQRFGKYDRVVNSGFHVKLPWPIESKKLVPVQNYGSTQDQQTMLTKDANLVTIELGAQYLREDPKKYLFNVQKPEDTVLQVVEAAIREVVGQTTLAEVLAASSRLVVIDKTKELAQKTLDSYGAGIRITTVNLTNVNVPEAVRDSQQDANKAVEDRGRSIAQAQTYSNDIVPKARGAAQAQVLQAQAYKAQVVALAQGDAARFNQLLVAYERAPQVTRSRLYYETIEQVLANSKKVIVDTRGNGQILYLPLDKLMESGAGGLPALQRDAQGRAASDVASDAARGSR